MIRRTWFVVVAALGCGSVATPQTPGTAAHAHGSAGSAAPASAANAAAGASVAGANLPDLPATAPAKPHYEVPVANPDLAPYTGFDVGGIDWTITGQDVELSYTFPRALSGVANQSVWLRGTLTEPGVAAIAGDPGSARCAFSAAVVSCQEMMTGLATDPANAIRMLQQGGVSDQERTARAQVIQAFSSDPIGVLTFAAPNKGGEKD